MDLNDSNRTLELRWALSWETTTCSTVFDRKGRLEISQKLLILSGLSPGFLMMGVTAP